MQKMQAGSWLLENHLIPTTLLLQANVMADILDFGSFKEKKPEQVWECANCGGQLYYIMVDGLIECYKCSRKTTNPALDVEEE